MSKIERPLLEQTLHALELPCNRWISSQRPLVEATTKALRDQLQAMGAEGSVPLSEARPLLQQALTALQMPCERWSQEHTLAANAAIDALEQRLLARSLLKPSHAKATRATTPT